VNASQFTCISAILFIVRCSISFACLFREMQVLSRSKTDRIFITEARTYQSVLCIFVYIYSSINLQYAVCIFNDAWNRIILYDNWTFTPCLNVVGLQRVIVISMRSKNVVCEMTGSSVKDNFLVSFDSSPLVAYSWDAVFPHFFRFCAVR